jgi:hypothetical protein
MMAYTGSRLKVRLTVKAEIVFSDSANKTYKPTVQKEAKIIR